MTRRNKWLVGGLAVAALSAAAFGAVARNGGEGWRHHGGGWHHGWHRGRGMKRPMRMVCGRKAPQRIDHMLVRIKHKAEITEAQTPAFEEFADTVRAAAAKARQSCPPKPAWKTRDRNAEGDDEANNKPRLRRSPIERLENMENMLVAGLEAIRTIRPSAEKLYASLSEEQQLKLRKMRGKRGWWKRNRWRRHRGYDRDGPRDNDRDNETEDTR